MDIGRRLEDPTSNGAEVTADRQETKMVVTMLGESLREARRPIGSLVTPKHGERIVRRLSSDRYFLILLILCK